MKKSNTSQNHPNHKNYMVFYYGSYNDKMGRGLTHNKLEKNKINYKMKQNCGAPNEKSSVIGALHEENVMYKDLNNAIFLY